MPDREPAARDRIRAQLANAGWRDSQIEQEGGRYPEQQKALRGGRPDFVLYAEQRRAPLAVIEAKRPGKKLRDAIAQALGYARALGAPVVFASDGSVVASAHIADGRPLVMNDAEVSSFLPEKHLRHFEGSRVWDRGAGFAASGDLIKIFKSARAVLNGEGIAKVEAFNEFAKLLFVKILTELHDDDGEMFRDIPARWPDFAGFAGDKLMREYRRALAALNDKYEGGFETTQIRRAQTLESLVGLIAGRSFIDTDADVKGGAYEYFLRDYTKDKDELNRYFTPRHIVRAMVQLANPQSDEKIYDPFCGTGGMLIEAYRHILRRLPAAGDARRRALRRLRRDALFGRDISDAASVAKMNMILIGDGHSNIERGDSLAKPPGRYDVVVTNIPFSSHGEEDYIRHCLDAARDNPRGRALIIVPERIIRERQYRDLRHDISREWNIERVISLPRYVFAEYTNAKTSVLFVSWRARGQRMQKSVNVFKVVHDGFKGSNRRKPAFNAPNDIADMLQDDFPPRAVEIVPPDYCFNQIAGAAALRARRGWPLVKVGDVIAHIERPVEIRAGMVCLEPGFNAKEHRVFVNKRKPYHQVAASGRRRWAIRKGDLVVGLLHTQNGLIAYYDGEEELHATKTHPAFAVDEAKVDRRYLFWTLRDLLMTMEREDTVGRENFKVREILDLPLPLPPPAEQRKIGAALDAARQKICDAERALQKARQEFEAAIIRHRSFEI